MRSIVQVTVHASQFPGNVQQTLRASLRTGRINHKFLYDGVRHAQKWLALHEAYSPARTVPDCVATYEKAFAAAARNTPKERVHVVGLGCGGGQKDAQLLALLKRAGRKLSYTPCDVSLAMVLAACQTASEVLDLEDCFPLVCDLAEADDLTAVLEHQCPPDAGGLVTFFGMLPNFEPQVILPRLAGLVRAGDRLLLDANLAPGPDYAFGVQSILPQYDNELTRDWLMTFLLDIGVERSDGDLQFAVQDDMPEHGLKRVVAEFHFKDTRRIEVQSEMFEFLRGESLRLFFSYRHTPDRVGQLLARHGLAVVDQWVTRAEDEGVFLCQRKPLAPR